MDWKKLYESLVWPAVAGNVLWCLLQVAVSAVRGEASGDPFPAIVSLLVIGIYTVREWMTATGIQYECRHVACEAAFAAAIAATAIAIQLDTTNSTALHPAWVCLSIYAVGGFAHALNIWKSRSEQRRWAMAAAHIVLGALASPPVLRCETRWITALALVAMFAASVGSRRE
jgi:hypothetical protein